MDTVLVIAVTVLLVLLAAGTVSRFRWERRVPPTPAFARPKGQSTSLRATLKRDTNASVQRDTWRFLWSHVDRYWFTGTGCPPQKLRREEYIALQADHVGGPVLVGAYDDRQFWWWDEDFYWENGGYTADDVRAVVLESRRRNQRQLERAHSAAVLAEGATAKGRTPISEEVRRLVWRRDGGRCQNCGSGELLQFDHVIPVALGGSSEPENLQLLCARCNREKSASI